ncbi:NAD-P-binding protein [Mycena filopes]|nr:NAD-P-binding protein [Mycena filopes]
MSRGVVLITGINGFLSTYTALAFLDAGYTVKGVARTEAKAADWINKFPAHKAAYQFTVVPDFAPPGAFDDAVKGCDVIVHVASPNTNDISDPEKTMLIPAISGTKNLLESTKKEPRIRRVPAMMDTTNTDTGKVYTPEDWNPTTYDVAKVSTNPRVVYGASKAVAERAFWDYIKDEKPSWAGATVLPCGVFDPPIQPGSSIASLNRSVAFLWDMLQGKHKGRGLAISHALFVSARDNKRYILIGGTFTLAQIDDIVARRFPTLRPNLPTTPDLTCPARKQILGSKFLGLETVLVDTIEAIQALEKAA